MKKTLLALCTFTTLSVSAFAAAPAPMAVKCQTFDTNGKNEIQKIELEYGMGQAVLKLKDAKGVIVDVSDDNEMIPGLYDVRLFLENSIVAAKGVAQSDNQVNGVHVVQLSGKRAVSIHCGI